MLNQVINYVLLLIINRPYIVIIVIFFLVLFYKKNSIIKYFYFVFNIFRNHQQPTNTTHSPTTLTEETLAIMESIEEMEQEIYLILKEIELDFIDQEFSGENEQSSKLKSLNILERFKVVFYLFLYKIIKVLFRSVFNGFLFILKIFKKGLGGKRK